MLNEWLFLIPIIINVIWLSFTLQMISDFNRKILFLYFIFYIIWIVSLIYQIVILFRIVNFLLGTLIVSFLILGLKKIRIMKSIWFYFVFYVQELIISFYFFVYVQTFSKSLVFPNYLNFDKLPIFLSENNVVHLSYFFAITIVISIVTFVLIYMIYNRVDSEKFY